LSIKELSIGGTRRVKEWIVAVVENRASTEDSLVAREAPVNGGVDGGPVESRDQLRESKTVLAEHFQRLEPVVIRPILELQSNRIIACASLGQLESNSRGIVSIPDISGLVTVALVTLNRLMNGL